MTLRFLDSFDHYASANINQKYNYVLSSRTFEVDAAYGREGQGISFTSGSVLATIGVLKSVLSNEYVVGAAFKRVGGTTIFLFGFQSPNDSDARGHLSLYVNAGGNLVLTKGTTSTGTGSFTILDTSVAAIDPDVWNYIELKVQIGAGGYAIANVNGVEFINYSGDTYNPASTAPYNSIGVSLFGNNNSGTSMAAANLVIDDFYICDLSGSSNNDFLGDTIIRCIYPDQAGAHDDFTPDSGTNYARVNEHAPDGDTSYVEGSAIGDQDSYGFDDIPDTNVSIAGIQAVFFSMKMDSGGALYKNLHRRSGADALTTQEESVPTAYGYQVFPLDKDPCDNNDWSVSKVNSIEAGMERTG